MAVKKIAKKKSVVKKKSELKKAGMGLIDVSLPSAPTVISDNLEDYTYMIYGERKIGKTTILSEFDDVLFLMFDPINKGLSIRQVYLPSWLHFLKILKELEKNPNYCKMVVIDTGYMCYERCYQYMISKLGITDPKDKAWGSAWKEIGKEFMQAHDIIFQLGIGFAVTAHTAIVEITRRDGSTYNKLTTQLGAQAFKFYNGLVDVIAYYQYSNKNERELSIKGDSLVEAGARVENHFQYPDGSDVEVVPMGKSSKEAYRNLELAFNNKLKKQGKEGKKVAVKKKH